MMKTTIVFIAVTFLGVGHSKVNGAAIEEEVFNGHNAMLGQFPFITLLMQQSILGMNSVCGGSLISTKWVMTAGHCSYRTYTTIVYFGVVNITDAKEGVTRLVVPRENHIIHPQYNPKTLQYDIALLSLPSEVQTSQYVGIINLPKLAENYPSIYDNTMATVCGWGQTSDNSTGTAHTLQYRKVNIMSHSQCVDYYKQINQVTDGNICADKEVVYAGSCRGDSGSPIFQTDFEDPVAIGLVSWGVGTCTSKNPVVITKIAYFLKWISAVTKILIS